MSDGRLNHGVSLVRSFFGGRRQHEVAFGSLFFQITFLHDPGDVLEQSLERETHDSIQLQHLHAFTL